MTTYRLPEMLGGGEVEATEQWGGCAGGRPEYQIGGITVLMPPGLPMEQILPPLPPEPTEQGWYLATIGENQVPIERQTDGWWLPSSRQFASSWEQLHEDFPGITLVRLVPASEPVELPWQGASLYSTNLRVALGNSDPVNLTVGSELVALGREGASEMGYALLAAAAAKVTALPPPCGETWEAELGCIASGSAHLCELIGGHRTHLCVCSAVLIEDGAA